MNNRFVTIPGVAFLMGSEHGQQGESPVHRISVDAFDIAAWQTTNSEFGEYLAATQEATPPLWNKPNFDDPRQPVVAVSWDAAMRYCVWLTERTRRIVRLPTEAEWELAARGGLEGSEYVWGNQLPSERPEYLARWGPEVEGPLPVALGTPNGYGLFDITENVHEWCFDWFDESYYAVSPAANPRGPEHGSRKASRGGSWRHRVKVSRCAARSSIPPALQYADYGFRIVRELN